MKTLFAVLLTFLSLTAFAGETTVKVLPGDPAHRVCLPGDVWSVQMQCDTGTRTGIERIWPGGSASMPGVESCAVVYSGCQPIAYNGDRTLRPGREATDSGLPMAVVIFGINRIVDKPGL
jgi:hypothetical protein